MFDPERQFTPSQETLKLAAFIAMLPAGAYLSYENIEQKLGIAMTSRGKATLRRACRRCKREYRADRGNGIELDGPANAMAIVAGKTNRIRGALVSARETSSNVGRFADDMSQEDRDRWSLTVSLLGAIEASAQSFKKLYKPSPQALNTINRPVIPKTKN